MTDSVHYRLPTKVCHDFKVFVKWCKAENCMSLNILTHSQRKSPRVKNNNPLGMQKKFPWISKSRLVRAARETSKFPNWSLLTISCRRYMAEILSIRRKTQFNQSINIQHKAYFLIRLDADCLHPFACWSLCLLCLLILMLILIESKSMLIV